MARPLIASALFGIALFATSCAQPDTGVSVDGAWIATPLGEANEASGFATIHNGGGVEDRLLSASSPRAGEVTLHEMNMDGPVMTMRPLEGGLLVPAHGDAELATDGAHLMFMGVGTALTAGETVPVVLRFEHAGAVSIDFTVADHAPTADAHETHD